MQHVRARLGGRPDSWQIREVGDGNLNLVFIVEGPDGSVCVKQALPYVRAAGPSWPMSPERAFFENAYYSAVAPYVGTLIPKIYHYDPELYCIGHGAALAPYHPEARLDRRTPLPATSRAIMGEYVARACFFTSDFAWPFERKMDGIALFAGNKALVRITRRSDFLGSLLVSPRNRHTSPQLDEIVCEPSLRRARLKLPRRASGRNFSMSRKR